MCHSNKSTLGHAGSSGCFDVFSTLVCVQAISCCGSVPLQSTVALSISVYMLGQRI